MKTCFNNFFLKRTRGCSTVIVFHCIPCPEHQPLMRTNHFLQEVIRGTALKTSDVITEVNYWEVSEKFSKTVPDLISLCVYPSYITYITDRLHRLMDEDLRIISSPKDLGITVLKDLKGTSQISHVVAKSDRMLGFLKRNYSGDLNKESLKLLQLVPFQKKLKSFSYNRLSSVFHHEHTPSYKLVCPRCHHANTATLCSC